MALSAPPILRDERDPAGRGTWVWDFGRPLPCVSNAVLGGGCGRRRWLLHHGVASGWAPAEPLADLRRLVRRQRLSLGRTVVLVTAVSLHELHTCARPGVTLWATVGVRNAARAGSPPPPWHGPGTINLVALVDGRPLGSALLDLYGVAVEAKAAALLELGVRTADDQPATGTTTDTVTILATGRGSRFRFGGTATPQGIALGAAVRELLGTALGG